MAISDETLLQYLAAYQNNNFVNVDDIRSFCLWIQEKYQLKNNQIASWVDNHGTNMSLFLSNERPATTFVNPLIEHINRLLKPHQIEYENEVPLSLDENEKIQIQDKEQVKKEEERQNLVTQVTEFNSEMDQLVSKFIQKHSTIENITKVRPVVCGHSTYGNQFGVDVLLNVQIVTIYEAPSEDAWLTGCAGYGKTGEQDSFLMAKYEQTSLFAMYSCVVEAIKMPCSSTFNVTYTKDERKEWVKLLVKQLKLFPRLAKVRVVCCSETAKLLFAALRIQDPKKCKPLFSDEFEAKIPFIWFSHPSPVSNIFTNLEQERIEYAQHVKVAPQPHQIEESAADLNRFKKVCGGVGCYNMSIFAKRKRDLAKPSQSFNAEKSVDLQHYSELVANNIIMSDLPKQEIQQQENPQQEPETPDQFISQGFNISVEQNTIIAEREGHCQYDSILFMIGEFGRRNLREEVATYLLSNFDRYKQFVTINFDEYIQGIRENEWGDHITLTAISNILGRDIRVHSVDNSHILITNDAPVSKEDTLDLGYLNRIHYIPLYKKDCTIRHHTSKFGTKIITQSLETSFETLSQLVTTWSNINGDRVDVISVSLVEEKNTKKAIVFFKQIQTN